MIELEFKINNDEISQKYLKLIKKADETALQINYFLMSIKFLIDGKDVFFDKRRKNKNNEWHAMPLIDWSTYLLNIVETLPQLKKNRFTFRHEGYRDVIIEMISDDKVKLIYKENLNTFIVDYDELLKVFQRFEKNVKEFLNKNVPQLQDHPYWGSWIKGETKWVNEEGLVPIKKK